jgi:hypothetical protein
MVPCANFFEIKQDKNIRFKYILGFNETPRSLLALKKWAHGTRRLAHGARVGQSALGASLLRLDA